MKHFAPEAYAAAFPRARSTDLFHRRRADPLQLRMETAEETCERRGWPPPESIELEDDGPPAWLGASMLGAAALFGAVLALWLSR